MNTYEVSMKKKLALFVLLTSLYSFESLAMHGEEDGEEENKKLLYKGAPPPGEEPLHDLDDDEISPNEHVHLQTAHKFEKEDKKNSDKGKKKEADRALNLANYHYNEAISNQPKSKVVPSTTNKKTIKGTGASTATTSKSLEMDDEYPKTYKIPKRMLSNGTSWEMEPAHQEKTSTCTSHAVVECLKYVHKRNRIHPYYLHHYAHFHLGTTKDGKRACEHYGTGHYVPHLMEFALEHGVPELPEGHNFKLGKNDTDFSYANGKTKYAFEQIIDVYENEPGHTKVEQIKNALRKYNHPIVISVISDQDGEDLFDKEVVPLEANLDTEEDFPLDNASEIIGHAVTVYGYSDTANNGEGALLIKNSWGRTYASQGRAELKYAYLNTHFHGPAYLGLGIKSTKKAYPHPFGFASSRPMVGYKYEVYCHTYNKGTRYLEAFPRAKTIRPRPEADTRDQVWYLKAVQGKPGYYRIGCDTRHKGTKYLEAFPRLGEVKPKSSRNHRDQHWFIEKTEGGYYRIGCHTKHGGKRYLEAFPRDNVVRSKPIKDDPHHSKFNQDQLWKFERLKKL